MALDFDHFIGVNSIPGGARFHPDNKSYICAAGGNVLITDLIDSKQEFLRGHDDRVTCLTVSKSGSMIASGQMGTNSNVLVWDYESRKLMYTMEEHDDMVQAVAFSEDEKILATLGGNEDRKMVLWDISTGNIIAFTNKVPLGTLCISFGGFIKDIKRRETDHYQICTGGKQGLQFWDLDPYQGDLVPFSLAGDSRANLTRTVTDLCFSDDKEYVYGATESGDFLVGSLKHARILQAVQATKLGLDAIVCLNNNALAVGCGDKTVKFFDRNFEYLGKADFDGIICGLSASTNKAELLVSSGNGTIYRLNAETKQHIVIAEAHTSAITSLAFAVDNNDRFCTASRDGTIRVWDCADYIVLATCRPRRDQDRGVVPLCVAMSDIVLSGWSDGKVNAYSDEGEALWVIDNAHIGGVCSITLSHNKRFILTGGPDGDVRLWELRTRDLISHLKEHVGKVTSLVLSQDDTFAVTGSRDRCILRWDLRQEKRVHCHMQRMGGINGLCLSKNEDYIVSVGQEKKLCFWPLNDTHASHVQPLSAEREDPDEGRVVVLSNSGRYIATGGTAGLVRLWDYRSSTLVSEAAGHSGTISAIQFSPDDKQVVSVGEDGSIFLWMLMTDNGESKYAEEKCGY